MAFDPYRRRDTKSLDNPFSPFLPRERSGRPSRPSRPSRSSSAPSPTPEPVFRAPAVAGGFGVSPTDELPVSQEDTDTSMLQKTLTVASPFISGRSAVDTAIPFGDPGTAAYNKLVESGRAGTWAAVALDALLAPITIVEAVGYAAGLFTGGSTAAVAGVSTTSRAVRLAKIGKALRDSKKLSTATKVASPILKTSVPKTISEKGGVTAASYILGRNVAIDGVVTGTLSTDTGKRIAEENPHLAIGIGLGVGAGTFLGVDVGTKIATTSTVKNLVTQGRLGVKPLTPAVDSKSLPFLQELGVKIGISDDSRIMRVTKPHVESEGKVFEGLAKGDRYFLSRGDRNNVVKISGYADEDDVPYVFKSEAMQDIASRPIDPIAYGVSRSWGESWDQLDIEQTMKAFDDPSNIQILEANPEYRRLIKLSKDEIIEEASLEGISPTYRVRQGPLGAAEDGKPKTRRQLVSEITLRRFPEISRGLNYRDPDQVYGWYRSEATSVEKDIEEGLLPQSAMTGFESTDPFYEFLIPGRGKGKDVRLKPSMMPEQVLKATVDEDALDDVWNNHRHEIEDPLWFGSREGNVYEKYNIDKDLMYQDGVGGHFIKKQDLEDYLTVMDIMETSPNFFGVTRDMDKIRKRHLIQEIYEEVKNDGKQVAFPIYNSLAKIPETYTATFPNLTLYGTQKMITSVMGALRPFRSLVSQSLNPGSAMKEAMITSIRAMKKEFEQIGNVQLISSRGDSLWNGQNRYIKRVGGTGPKRNFIEVSYDATDVHKRPDYYQTIGFLNPDEARLIKNLSFLTAKAADLPSTAGAHRFTQNLDLEGMPDRQLKDYEPVSDTFDAGVSGNVYFVPEVIDANSVRNARNLQEQIKQIYDLDTDIGQDIAGAQARAAGRDADVIPPDYDDIQWLIGSDGQRFHTEGMNTARIFEKPDVTGASPARDLGFRPDGLMRLMRKDNERIYIPAGELQTDYDIRVYDPWASAEMIAGQSADLFIKRHIVKQALRTTNGHSEVINTILRDLDFAPSDIEKIDNYYISLDPIKSELERMPLNKRGEGIGMPIGASTPNLALQMTFVGQSGKAGALTLNDIKYINQFLQPNREKPLSWWKNFADKANTFGVYVATTVDIGGALILAPYAAGSRAGLPAVGKAFANGIRALGKTTEDFEAYMLQKTTSDAYRIASTEYGVRIMDWSIPDPKKIGDVLPKGPEDFTLQDMPDFLRNIPIIPLPKGKTVRFGSFEQAFITSMNDIRVSSAMAEGTFLRNMKGAPLSAQEKRGIGEAWNYLTAVPDATKRGDYGRYLFFADGFFRSQRDALRAALSSDAPIAGPIIRNQILTVVGAGMLVSGLSAMSQGRDPRDVLNPLDEKALSRGQIRINPNLGSIRLGEFDVDTLGWLKPFGAMMVGFFNTGVDILDDDEDKFHNELWNGVSRFIDQKGSPIVRAAQEVVMKGGYDFDGNPVMSPIGEPLGTARSGIARFTPIWLSQGIDEGIEEYKEQSGDGEISADDLRKVGVDSFLIGMGEFIGLRINPMSPKEVVQSLVLKDKELNPFHIDWENLNLRRREAFKVKYPGEFKRYEDFNRLGAYPTLEMKGFDEVENIKAKLEQDISDNYDLFMGRNEGNFASKSDFINTISALKRNAAEDIRVVRNAHNINFRASGSMAEIMNEYYKAYEDNTIAGRLFFDERGELPGVEAQHAALLKRIEAGEFGGEDPNIKRLNIELFNERTFANTGTVAVDVMLDAKTWISANTNYYELLDTFTKKYGRQYESLLGIGPIENYTQLLREIGILDRMEDEYLLSGDPSKRAQYRAIAKRLSTARKLQNRVTRETGKERDRMRARNKELDANLIIIGK